MYVQQAKRTSALLGSKRCFTAFISIIKGDTTGRYAVKMQK